MTSLPPKKSISIFRKRVRKFKTLKRGYYSFLILVFLYLASFILPVLINNKALVVRYNGSFYFPIATYYPASSFGVTALGDGEPDYRELHRRFKAEHSGNWVLMPPYPYSATENLFDMPGSAPHRPSREHIFGTDNSDRDVFARLAYGFNVSLSFALLVLVLGQGFGILVGALLGYYGGKIDILGLRLIEIWSSMPFLYTIIIISSIVVPVYIQGSNLIAQPAFWMLVGILAIFDWMGITYYVRGEFYREKSKDYVGAAIAMGVSEPAIIVKHILPNALTPVVSFAPFAIVASIEALVALDFLGFGLPAPTPSWGELIEQGTTNFTDWWLTLFPLLAVFATLLLIVFIGESVREAFDPKEYSRLR